MHPIRISVTGFAEFLTARPDLRHKKLFPFKFNKRGEGFARISYYQPTISAIRNYHRSGNDLQVLESARVALQKQVDEAEIRRDEIRFTRNIEAIDAYRRIYARRKFKILPNRRIAYRLGPLVITARPDLWVEEDGTQVLIKIGMSKKNPVFVDIVLYLIRKAAVDSGHRIRARNVVYLNVTTGKEQICDIGLIRFNKQFRAAAREIVSVWPALKQSGEATSAV